MAELLKDDKCRLITLVGPGGVGKTRLALEAAAQQGAAFRDGTAFIALASVNSRAAILPAVAGALGLSLYGSGDPEVQLLTFLRDKQMLLLVDNVEHLLEAAGLWVGLLQIARTVKLLLTSREALNLQGEWVFEVEDCRFRRASRSRIWRRTRRRPCSSNGPAALASDLSCDRKTVRRW